MMCKNTEAPTFHPVEKIGLKVYTSGSLSPSIFTNFTPELVSGFLDRCSVSKIVLEIEMHSNHQVKLQGCCIRGCAAPLKLTIGFLLTGS